MRWLYPEGSPRRSRQRNVEAAAHLFFKRGSGRRTLHYQFESEEVSRLLRDAAQSAERLRDCVSAQQRASGESRARGSAGVISGRTICKMLVKSRAAGGGQLKHGVAVLVHFDEADPSPVRTSADWSGAEWKTSQSKPTEEFNFILAGLPCPTIVLHHASWLSDRRELTGMNQASKSEALSPRPQPPRHSDSQSRSVIVLPPGSAQSRHVSTDG